MLTLDVYASGHRLAQHHEVAAADLLEPIKTELYLAAVEAGAELPEEEQAHEALMALVAEAREGMAASYRTYGRVLWLNVTGAHAERVVHHGSFLSPETYAIRTPA